MPVPKKELCLRALLCVVFLGTIVALFIIGELNRSLYLPSHHVDCKISIIGGGVGGLYSAFRLINSSTYRPNEVCIFEREGRVGGRIRSLRGVFGSLNPVDVGARRFEPTVHRIANDLITKVLRLSSVCSHLSAECDGTSEIEEHFYLRDTYFANLSSSEGLPYRFNPDERWGPNLSEDHPPDVEAELFKMLPFIEDNYDNLTSKEDSIRYPALKQVLEEIRRSKFDGLSPSAVDVRSAIKGHSAEWWQLYLDTEGESGYYIHLSVYDRLREILLYLGATENGEQTFREVVDDQGHKLGFSTFPETLAKLLQSMGVKIQFNSELISILQEQQQQQPSTHTTHATQRALAGAPLTLVFANKKKIVSEKVILNIPAKEFNKLSRDSVIFTKANDKTRNVLYSLFRPVSSIKLYGYFKEAWWYTKLGLTEGEMYTTTNLRYFDWSDGHTSCAPSPTTTHSTTTTTTQRNTTECPGFVIMAFPPADQAPYFKIPQSSADPVVVIDPNGDTQTDPRKVQWMQEVGDIFLETHKGLLAATGTTTTTTKFTPEAVAMGVWDEAWHYTPATSEFEAGEANHAMLRPVEGLDVFVANEAFSVDQGWAEGSLIAAEKIMYFYFNLPRPDWLASPSWHDAIIANPRL